MLNKILKIGFIGAGAIGTLFGGYIAMSSLEQFKIKVILFARSDHVNQINKKGLFLQKKNKQIIKINYIEAFENYFNYKKVYPLDQDDDFDFLFISTKAYDTLRAIKEYKQLVKSSRWILILQNGIGNDELIKYEVRKEKLVRIVTSHGALLKEPGYVIHTGVGFTKMGTIYTDELLNQLPGEKANTRNLSLLKKILDKVNIETEIVNNIMYYCWEKALVNIGINAIGAITRLKNGQLIKIDYLKRIMVASIEEALTIAENEGFLFQKNTIFNLMLSVAEDTAENENSMLQDIRLRKPTEIDFLNGKIVDIGQDLGFDVPINRTLTNMIKGLEQTYLNRN